MANTTKNKPSNPLADSRTKEYKECLTTHKGKQPPEYLAYKEKRKQEIAAGTKKTKTPKSATTKKLKSEFDKRTKNYKLFVEIFHREPTENDTVDMLNDAIANRGTGLTPGIMPTASMPSRPAVSGQPITVESAEKTLELAKQAQVMGYALVTM